ncbi:hypothetical protein CAPTEDRAFT_165774 [Capitella teleta]|uniref:Amidase domain-containing protein n=1 Tax=Capitella teleta TaxID=283909 RepID=R7VGI6_CAPTE|nr:hypothetical protein CAPTEDRAFT_165774 [Capitella teleta]|eukprot:ELU17709.1 hypothetical protein CAPTEDRAFT_165774 [Capitella teleta]
MADNVYRTPAVQPPTVDKLRQIATKYGFGDTSEKDLQDYQVHISHLLKAYTKVSEYPEPTLPVNYPRTPGYRPGKEENKHNAWYYKSEIKGAPNGILSGKNVAIKDCIPVAGVPMMNGATMMEGYVPDIDATVVTRALDAGATIKGKAVCEFFCLSSGSSFTCGTGAILNPFDKTRSAGGSSNGCAVLLANGEVDLALAADQGGSIRLPASWCGVVGMKPTFGLVPYTGVATLEPTMDHVGPMARNAKDCALLLEAVAGCDGELDSRQRYDYTPPKYSEMLNGDLKGVKIGLVKEGFVGCEGEIDLLVKEAAMKLTAKGAVVEEVSISMHTDGAHIAVPVIAGGAYNHLILGNSGIGAKGYYPTGMISVGDRAMKSGYRELTPTLKKLLMLGEYVNETHGVKHYARSQNVSRLLAEAYDRVLGDYDVIVMPTIKFKPPKLPTGEPSIHEYLSAVFANIANVASFNVTGHPSLTVNAGFAEGLPVGMLICAKRFNDVMVLRVAHAHELIRDQK